MDGVSAPWERPLHKHRKAQLVYTARGVVTCETLRDTWIVPAQCAVWIPPEVSHRAGGSGEIETYCLFVDAEYCSDLPKECCALSVCPLFQELIRRAARLPEDLQATSRQEHLARVILDELRAAPVEELRLPMPTDARLRRIAEGLIVDPADKATASMWASRVGLGERTLSRMLSNGAEL